MVNRGADGTAITVTPAAGYQFVNWSDGSTDNPRQDNNVTADITVTANFAIHQFTVTFEVESNGELSGALNQTINDGSDCTEVTATPNSGYEFVNWMHNGVEYSVDNPLTVTNVKADMNIQAYFIADTTSFTLRLRCNPVGSGSVAEVSNDAALRRLAPPTPAADTVIINSGTRATIKAVASEGYSFSGWTGSATATIKDIFSSETTVNLTGDALLTANFASNDVKVLLEMNSSPKKTGELTPLGKSQISTGAIQAITATPPNGYQFIEWDSDGDVYIHDKYSATTYATIKTDVSVTAVFATTDKTASVIIDSSPDTNSGIVENQGRSNAQLGISRTLKARSKLGHVFDYWEVIGDADIADIYAPETTITIDGDVRVTAHFVKSKIRSKDLGRIRIFRSKTIGKDHIKISRARHTLSKFDPETTPVRVTAGGKVFDLTSDNGTFTQRGNAYNYNSNDGSVHFLLNITRRIWNFTARNVLLDNMDNTEGVDIILKVGDNYFGANITLDESQHWQFNQKKDESEKLSVSGNEFSDFEIITANGRINNSKNSHDYFSIKKAWLALPPELNFSPSTTPVIVTIDDLSIIVPVGSFKTIKDDVYSFADKKNGIKLRLNFRKNQWRIDLRKIDLWKKITPDNGIDVYMNIGGYESGERIKPNVSSRYKYKHKKL